MLAAPDAVAVPEAPRPVVRAEGTVSSCTKIESPPAGRLLGRVLEAGTQDVPLAAVKVAVLGGTVQATTDTDGTFRLTGLPVGRVSLLLSKDGYFEGEKTAEARALVPAEPAPFFLTPVTLPPKLSLDDLFEVQTTMLHQGEAGLYRVALLDPPQEMLSVEAIQTWRARFDSAYAALYFPWVKVDDASNGNLREMPPSGHMAGLIARTDLQRGVHRAPANFVLQGVKALTLEIDDATQGVLNPLGVNCLRVLTGRGLRVYGARTVSSDAVWLYLNVRRLLLMIEETIEESNHWAVFEPNNETLRQALTFNLNGFLDTLWRQGALAGDSPEAAYQVRCDAENNTPDIVDAGKVIADIAVAPTIPYEFIHLRLGRTVEAVQVSER